MPLYTPSTPSATWQPSDVGLLAWNCDAASITPGGGAALPTAGTLYVQAVPLRTAASITNVVVCLTVNGSVLTSGQCFAALYQGVAGTLIGQTADQSTNWGSGATKIVTAPLASGPFPAAAGIVYVALWFNGTTGPTFYRTSNIQTMMNVGLVSSASRWGTANGSVTTTAPGTLGTISAAPSAYWVGLS